MPTVGKKKFPYTKQGETAAAEYANKTGKKMIVKPPVKKATKKKTK